MRKIYEVVGYVMDGYFLCPDCHGDPKEDSQEVFLGDIEPDDYCDACFHKRMESDHALDDKCPSWVYLDGEGP